VRHFLSSVDCEIAFAGGTMATLVASIEPIKTYMESIGFTECKEILESSVSFETSPDGKAPRKIEQVSKATGHFFRNPDSELACSILADKITLGTRNYTGFEDFSSALDNIVTCLTTHLENRDVVKVGLKKVNSIVMEKVTRYDAACSIFNPAIFALLRSGLPTSSVKIAQEVLVLETESSASLLRNTLRALDDKNSYEASLDFDVVSRKTSTSKVALETTLKELNQVHFDLFKWAVTKEMIALMNKEGN